MWALGKRESCSNHMRRSGLSTHFRYLKNQKWPSYTLNIGRKNEKIEKVAGYSFSCLRHRKEWPATFLSFYFPEAIFNV